MEIAREMVLQVTHTYLAKQNIFHQQQASYVLLWREKLDMMMYLLSSNSDSQFVMDNLE